MAVKKMTLISAEQDLKEYFGELFDKTNIRILQAARHGVSNAINALIDKTKQNVSGAYFNGVTSAGRTMRGKTYTIPLIQGVRAFLYQGEPTGFVHILGNTRTDDGTWRLRLFEGGTKQRKSKNGSYGRLRPARFFAPVAGMAQTEAVNKIKESISNAIDELNQ